TVLFQPGYHSLAALGMVEEPLTLRPALSYPSPHRPRRGEGKGEGAALLHGLLTLTLSSEDRGEGKQSGWLHPDLGRGKATASAVASAPVATHPPVTGS